MPKIFQLTKAGKLIDGIFRGDTINTPSMLCVEDLLSALDWADSVGGLPGLVARSEANLQAVKAFVDSSDWCDFLCADPANLSSTSICLKISDADIMALPAEEQSAFAKAMTAKLAEAGVAYDIGGYRTAPPGLRVWGGPTVEAEDMAALMPWLDWAFGEVRAEQKK
jgi:phosphoserine aminotransferase